MSTLADTLTEIEQAIVDHIHVLIPDLRTCRSFGGQFSSESLKRFSARSPAVLLACLAVPEFHMETNAIRRYRTRWAAYCLATDRIGMKRHIRAKTDAWTILNDLPAQMWGRDECSPITTPGPVANNLFDLASQKEGVALWGVRWEQAISLQLEVIP